LRRSTTAAEPPISGFGVNTWPSAVNLAASGDARNAGSACTAAVLRWLARGPRHLGEHHAEVDPVEEDLEHGRDDGRAARQPVARNGLPWLSRIVGAIELRGRWPGAGRGPHQGHAA
jgi:hypothetical protein